MTRRARPKGPAEGFGIDFLARSPGEGSVEESKRLQFVQGHGEFARRFRRLQPLRRLTDGNPSIAARARADMDMHDTASRVDHAELAHAVFRIDQGLPSEIVVER